MMGKARSNYRYMRLLLLMLLVSLSGCSTLSGEGGVFAYEETKPWHKALLAEERMQLEPYPMENSADQKIYFSRESASGGQGVGGGGCGCN